MTDIILHCLFLQLQAMENDPMSQGYRSYHPLVLATNQEKLEFYREYCILVELHYTLMGQFTANTN